MTSFDPKSVIYSKDTPLALSSIEAKRHYRLKHAQRNLIIGIKK